MLMAEWNLYQLLSVNDTALVADSEKRLRQLVEEFRRVVLRGNKVNESKATVRQYTIMVDCGRMTICEWKVFEKVEYFKIFRVTCSY